MTIIINGMLRHTSVASNYGRGVQYNEPLYNQDPGITKDIFLPSNISLTILRFHADLIVNHNTLYHPITIDTITKKNKMLIAINSWLCELLVCGYEVKWLISVEFIIMRH